MHGDEAQWEGLRSSSVDCTGWTRQVGHELTQSTLLLHRTGGRAFSVRTSGSAWKFVAQRGRFDYYPAGTYDEIVAGPNPMQALEVDIPVRFESSVLEEGRWAIEMSPRFQFQDRRLEALVLTMTQAAASAPSPSDAIMLSVAVVDRLYETSLPAERAARAPVFTETVKRLIVEYLDHSFGTSVGIEKVASLTGLARTQFAKLFRESFGSSLHQYVLARKVEIATLRLLEGGLVTDLSHELGFASHAHFSTVFKDRVGTTPSEFRRNGSKAPKLACKSGFA